MHLPNKDHCSASWCSSHPPGSALFARCDCCTAAATKCVATLESRPTVQSRCPKDQCCRIGSANIAHWCQSTVIAPEDMFHCLSDANTDGRVVDTRGEPLTSVVPKFSIAEILLPAHRRPPWIGRIVTGRRDTDPNKCQATYPGALLEQKAYAWHPMASWNVGAAML